MFSISAAQKVISPHKKTDKSLIDLFFGISPYFEYEIQLESLTGDEIKEYYEYSLEHLTKVNSGEKLLGTPTLKKTSTVKKKYRNLKELFFANFWRWCDKGGRSRPEVVENYLFRDHPNPPENGNFKRYEVKVT